MKLVMAVSRDGFVSRGPNDDMSWLGPFDKAAFRIITGVGGNVATSRRTARLMPETLKGRTIHTLSSQEAQIDGCVGHTSKAWGSLGLFQKVFGETGWLIGGLTLALAASEEGWLSEIHLCRSDRMCWEGTPFNKDLMDLSPRLSYRMKTRIGDTTVEVYR